MIEQSDRNCPRCGKRMMVEPDPNYVGDLKLIHTCWHCDFREVEYRKPQLRLIRGGDSGADRLKRVRLGETYAEVGEPRG